MSDCAHCDNTSLDGGRKKRCPACEELICPACYKQSTPTDCLTFADTEEPE